MMWVFLLVLFTSPLPLCRASPHQPRNLTWQVINGIGDVIWSRSKVTTPNTWWPDLFPDICKLSLGVSGWDLEGYSDTERASSDCAKEWVHRAGPPWGGCCNKHWRSLLRTQSFYVCPGFHRSQSLNPKCGGKADFYCKNWGCETSGEAYWKPSSSWDYIKVVANYSLAAYVPGGAQVAECDTWCHPLRVTFTEPGKKATQWTKGYKWGLRMYIDSYDHGLLFTIKLKIETPYTSVGPNKVLAPAIPQPGSQSARPKPPSPSAASGTINPPEGMAAAIPAASLEHQGNSHLTNLVREAFKVINATNPEATKSCWLCYDVAPPYYEGIAFIGAVNQTKDVNSYRWQQQPNVRLTLSAVTGQGLCVGKVPPTHEHLCNQTWTNVSSSGFLLPPVDGWWACSSGVTPCVNLQVLSDTGDFCVLVQLVPRLIYHPYEELLSHWDKDSVRTKREVGVSLSILLGLGLHAAGAAAGTSALAVQHQAYHELSNAIDADLERMENSISKLQESLTSLSEVVLQNRRELDLLFLHQEGLCAAVKEECCFYIDHSGIVKDSMAKVREGLAKRKKEREQSQGWFESLFNSSPWLTSLISTLLGLLVILLLLLSFVPCILNRLRALTREHIKDRISTLQIMMLRQQYQGLNQDEI